MVLRIVPPCRNCGGGGWYRMPDPAGRGDTVRCEPCNPTPPPPPMTPAELRDNLRTIGWSQEALAARLGYRSGTQVERWVKGTAKMPEHYAAWLRGVAQQVAANPPPRS